MLARGSVKRWHCLIYVLIGESDKEGMNGEERSLVEKKLEHVVVA